MVVNKHLYDYDMEKFCDHDAMVTMFIIIT